MAKRTLSVRVSEELHSALVRAAVANHSTVSAFVDEILEDALHVVEAMADELEKHPPQSVRGVMSAYTAMGRAHIERGEAIIRAIEESHVEVSKSA